MPHLNVCMLCIGILATNAADIASIQYACSASGTLLSIKDCISAAFIQSGSKRRSDMRQSSKHVEVSRLHRKANVRSRSQPDRPLPSVCRRSDSRCAAKNTQTSTDGVEEYLCLAKV